MPVKKIQPGFHQMGLQRFTADAVALSRIGHQFKPLAVLLQDRHQAGRVVESDIVVRHAVHQQEGCGQVCGIGEDARGCITLRIVLRRSHITLRIECIVEAQSVTGAPAAAAAKVPSGACRMVISVMYPP